MASGLQPVTQHPTRSPKAPPLPGGAT